MKGRKKDSRRKRAPRHVVKRWQFAWTNPDWPARNDDAHDWRSKTFRCATFEQAQDKMLDFVNSKPFEVWVDYECRAGHEPYDPARHERTFPRIPRAHPLYEHVN